MSNTSFPLSTIPNYVPIEVMSHIMRYVPYNDLQKWKEIPELLVYYNHQYRWALKCQYDYNIPIEQFNQTTRHPADRYLQILSRYDCTTGSECHLDIRECLRRSIERNNLDLFRYFWRHSETIDHVSIAEYRLGLAFKYNNVTIAQELFPIVKPSMGGNWRTFYDLDCSRDATRNKNRELIRLLDDRYHELWGLKGALQTGDLDFVNECMGHDSLEKMFNSHRTAIYDALIGGNPVLIEKALPYSDNSWGLAGAFAINSPTWIKYFCDQGVKVSWFHIVEAVERGHSDLTRQYLSSVRYDSAILSTAIRHKRNDIVCHLVTEYRNKIDFNDAILKAISDYNWEAFEYLVSVADVTDIPVEIDTFKFKEATEYLRMRRQKSIS